MKNARLTTCGVWFAAGFFGDSFRFCGLFDRKFSMTNDEKARLMRELLEVARKKGLIK